jgi:hypothetical protein
MIDPVVSDAMNALLRKIADFVVSYQISSFNEGDKKFAQWNEGVATAAMQVIDNNDNKELREAIDSYARNLYMSEV